MAKRYSGDLQINVVYDDRDFYRTAVSKDGRVLWRGTVRPAPSGFGRGVAYDSAQAYDEIARSALAFAEDDVRGIGDSAEFDDAGYKIRRVPRYWQQWPGGRVRPTRFASRDREPKLLTRPGQERTAREIRARIAWERAAAKDLQRRKPTLGWEHIAEGHLNAAAAYERLLRSRRGVR